MNTDQLIAHFDDLIDRYKDTQLYGNAGARAAARKELMSAYKTAVLAAPAPTASPACQHDLRAEYEGQNGTRAAICAKCGERVQTSASPSALTDADKEALEYAAYRLDLPGNSHEQSKMVQRLLNLALLAASPADQGELHACTRAALTRAVDALLIVRRSVVGQKAHQCQRDIDEIRVLLATPKDSYEVTADGWISVNEREPAPETDVLLKGHRPGFAEEKYDIGGLFHDKWMSEITQDDCKFEVTHWMEIPK